VGDGRVTDFLDFRLWPVFNLADAAICAGVAIFILAFLMPICSTGVPKISSGCY